MMRKRWMLPAALVALAAGCAAPARAQDGSGRSADGPAQPEARPQPGPQTRPEGSPERAPDQGPAPGRPDGAGAPGAADKRPAAAAGAARLRALADRLGEAQSAAAGGKGIEGVGRALLDLARPPDFVEEAFLRAGPSPGPLGREPEPAEEDAPSVEEGGDREPVTWEPNPVCKGRRCKPGGGRSTEKKQAPSEEATPKPRFERR